MSTIAAPNTPVAPASSLDELYQNVNQAFMSLYQQLNPLLATLQVSKAVNTQDGSSYPNTVAFIGFTGGAPTANGYVTITFANGTTAKLLARQ